VSNEGILFDISLTVMAPTATSSIPDTTSGLSAHPSLHNDRKYESILPRTGRSYNY
jgi:hypothetical protein